MKQGLRTLFLFGMGFSLAGVAIAQHLDQSEKIPGYFNPKTHTFTARTLSKNVSDAATSTYAGTLKYVYTVKLDTAVPSGDELVCEAGANVEDSGTGNFYEEIAEGKATVSGSTASCTVNIPYSWALSTASSDMVDVSYELSTVPVSPTSNGAEVLAREHESSLSPIKIPTTGATTTITISATI